MQGIIQDLREFELKIADKLSEVEQLEFHHLVNMLQERNGGLREAMDELTNGRWEKL